ncbi:MAG: CopG family transcriptional regulator [Glaciimonas sp.]|nr:CopG family transcriptional regulator [Glaciimonas sp.]
MFKFRATVLSLALLTPLAQAAIPVTLYKSPTCGCCEEYVKYLKANGFAVDAVNSNDMNRIKQEKHIGNNLVSCHTALIGGYAVEGHVPVAAIRKLLHDKPKLVGISAPGMPANSPGMGVMRPGTLKIYAIARNAKANPAVFSIE